MSRKGRGPIVNALLLGCGVMFASVGLLYSANPTHSDPFVALGMTRIETDSPIAAFDLKALNGGSLRSADLAGKVVLLNFWATWCGPCKEEMPSLARLQTRFDPARVRVVTVTADMYPQGIKQFLDHLHIGLPVAFDENEELTRRFMVRGLPTTVVIGRNGHVVGRAVGPRAWDGPDSVALVRQILLDSP
jgi:thiol-disulfide isomerase/thioredoxin